MEKGGRPAEMRTGDMCGGRLAQMRAGDMRQWKRVLDQTDIYKSVEMGGRPE